MCPNRNLAWKVLLIGGSSGVGKTVVARQLATHLALPLLLLDDIRLALQKATTDQTNPELHVFLNYRAEHWRDPESIYAAWITLGEAMVEPLRAIINHHIFVPSVGTIVIEGDGILPIASTRCLESKEVCVVYIVEQDEQQLLHNLRSRGRGFNDWGELEQQSFAHASWRYGQWLAREASKLELPVIEAQPQETIFERLLSIVGAE